MQPATALDVAQRLRGCRRNGGRFIATIALRCLPSIVQPLAEAVGVAEVIAGGDLTRSIKLSAMTSRHAS